MPGSVWLLRRLLGGLAVVLTISLLVFLAIRLLPSDPARVILGPGAPEASLQVLRDQLGLQAPLWQQYVGWLNALLHGNPGVSLDSQVSVATLLAERLGNSLTLLLPFALISTLLALGLGAWLAVHRDGRIDRAALALLVLFKSLPGFVLAIGLILIFATGLLNWLPAVSLLQPDRSLFSQLHYLVLPVGALVLGGSPYLIRLMRASMIEALHSEYVDAARLRGISHWRLVLGHALPNALVPLLQGLALTLSVFFSSSLLIEMAFAFPGLGSLLNDAIRLRDVPVIQAAVTLIALFVVLINLSADVLTLLISPRLRTAR